VWENVQGVRHFTKNSISKNKYEVYGMTQKAVGMNDFLALSSTGTHFNGWDTE
jgi:hypothetical protein